MDGYNYLAHYGVKGMKWGVRRTPEQLGRKSALTRGTHSDDIVDSGNSGKTGNDKITSKKLESFEKKLRVTKKADGTVSDIYTSVDIGSNKNVTVRSKNLNTKDNKQLVKEAVTMKRVIDTYNDDGVKNQIVDKYFKSQDGPLVKQNSSDKNTKNQMKNQLKLKTIEIWSNENSYNVFYDDGGAFYNHAIHVEGTLSTGKINDIYLDG